MDPDTSARGGNQCGRRHGGRHPQRANRLRDRLCKAGALGTLFQMLLQPGSVFLFNSAKLRSPNNCRARR
ncbi:MAG TPA: hypothetical protein VGK99_16680 [Acidobacteriota bacterium]